MSDVHLTVLFTWLLHTMGRALLTAMAMTFVGGGIVFAAGGPAALALLVGPVTFGMVLYLAEAPLPLDVDQD